GDWGLRGVRLRSARAGGAAAPEPAGWRAGERRLAHGAEARERVAGAAVERRGPIAGRAASIPRRAHTGARELLRRPATREEIAREVLDAAGHVADARADAADQRAEEVKQAHV